METVPESADAVRQGLAAHDYLADVGLATSIFLALAMRRPLLLEGEAGVGKTEVAKVLAEWTGGELVRLQCYEGIDASQARLELDVSTAVDGMSLDDDVEKATFKKKNQKPAVSIPVHRNIFVGVL